MVKEGNQLTLAEAARKTEGTVRRGLLDFRHAGAFILAAYDQTHAAIAEPGVAIRAAT